MFARGRLIVEIAACHLFAAEIEFTDRAGWQRTPLPVKNIGCDIGYGPTDRRPACIGNRSDHGPGSVDRVLGGAVGVDHDKGQIWRRANMQHVAPGPEKPQCQAAWPRPPQ